MVSPTSEQYDSLLRQMWERMDEGCGETIYVIGQGSGEHDFLLQLYLCLLYLYSQNLVQHSNYYTRLVLRSISGLIVMFVLPSMSGEGRSSGLEFKNLYSLVLLNAFEHYHCIHTAGALKS